MKIKTQIKYLEKARDLIADKKRWCQGANAKTADGLTVGTKSENAERFCAQGAVMKVAKTDYHMLIEALSQNCPDVKSITFTNDNKKTPHSHRRVIGVFKRVSSSALCNTPAAISLARFF